ncbi:hypothetical protein HDU76_000262 [Blyttiomyces sp. JEL0837]|nr:hypothetical protein HDU76_000262 [Blyttiomyces sp. JEL0837]
MIDEEMSTTTSSDDKACTVCHDNVTKSSFSKLTATCAHEDSVCKKCMERHCEAEVNTKGDIQVKCPICRTVLDHNEVKEAASKDIFTRYDVLLLRRALQAMPDFRWCKVSTCGAGQIHDPSGGPIMFCFACRAKSCYTHDVPWHAGLTCREFDATTESSGDFASEAYIERHAKECPKCRMRIVKNGGCDHMTCRACNHEFCWRCLASYFKIVRFGNHHHQSTCTFYAPYHSGDDDEEQEDEEPSDEEGSDDDDENGDDDEEMEEENGGQDSGMEEDD